MALLQLSHAAFPLAAVGFFSIGFLVFFGVTVGWGASEPIPVCNWGETDQKCQFMELKNLLKTINLVSSGIGQISFLNGNFQLVLQS